MPVTGFIEEDSPYASDGKKGTYYFEFSRPLRTMDRLQQVRMSIAAFSVLAIWDWKNCKCTIYVFCTNLLIHGTQVTCISHWSFGC